MNLISAPDRHRWLSNNSMIVAAKLATSPKLNWKVAKIGEIVEKISTGTTPPSQERKYYDGDIDWYTPSDIGGIRWLVNPKKTITFDAVSAKKARMFDIGTILITCIGQIGRVGILPKESSSNQQITGVKFISDIDPEFAYFSLFAKQDELEAAAPTASTLSILNQGRLSEIDFSYPDIKEQKQIAKFLAWCEDRLLSNKPFVNNYPPLPDYLNNLPRIVEHIESVAARVNEAQRLREEADIEAKAFIQATLREIFNASSNWQNYQLDEVAPINMGQSPSGDSYNFDREGEPLLNGPTEFGHHHPTPRQWTTSPTKFCKSGDILICVRGATTGKMNWADQKYCIGRGLAALTVDAEKCVPEYVYYFVLTQTQEILSRTAGSTFPNLPGEKLKSLPIPVPPLDEQRRIVAYLDGLQAKVNALRELQSASGEELSVLMPSVLDRAFKGEL